MKRTAYKDEVREIVSKAKAEGKEIALVPTMGYLHEGHLSLIREAGKSGAFVVVSVFVNPIQFGPKEDLASYPRDLEHDARAAEAAGAGLLFHPEEEEMYSRPLVCSIDVGEMGKILCGASRPGHFNGAATVVSKLLNIVQPARAYFGLKDYQQYLIIKKLVHDLDYPVEIVGMPIVREEDGLAMSSRNVFLSREERTEALVLSHSLSEAAEQIKSGEKRRSAVIEFITNRIKATSGVIDYVELRRANDLSVCEEIMGQIVIALAVRFGKTRLIDNMIVEG